MSGHDDRTVRRGYPGPRDTYEMSIQTHLTTRDPVPTVLDTSVDD